mmetsp:Transcript_19684/g.38784  ORF Transcript_19684/g.38784 Transcript_19684/m.38784 type:complete len:302 (+) Transcript_19684:422-1327(+)
MLHSEEEPKSHRGVAVASPPPFHAKGNDTASQIPRSERRLRIGRDGRIPRGQTPKLLLPRNEHAIAGGTSRDGTHIGRRIRQRKLRRFGPRHVGSGGGEGHPPKVFGFGRSIERRRGGRGRRRGGQRPVYGTRHRGQDLRRRSLSRIFAQHRALGQIRRAAAGGGGGGGFVSHSHRRRSRSRLQRIAVLRSHLVEGHFVQCPIEGSCHSRSRIGVGSVSFEGGAAQCSVCQRCFAQSRLCERIHSHEFHRRTLSRWIFGRETVEEGNCGVCGHCEGNWSEERIAHERTSACFGECQRKLQP